ncbi:MAG: AI-2E family transporter [Alphaproteobacteria bacterium]|nr:AI-2E family transporter [Alphaproteobacteria bacterium]
MASEIRPSNDSPLVVSESGLSYMLVFLSSGLIVAILYFASNIIVPITLAVLLSFLLLPAVRALRRWRVGRVTAVAITVLITFTVISGFGAVVVREISSLAQDLPAYRENLEAKVRTLPEVIPGGGVLHRAATILNDLRNQLTNLELRTPAESLSHAGSASAEPTKPIPVEIRQPPLEPLQLVESIIGPLLQPLTIAGLVIVFVVMILLDWEDLRDRVIRLAGRRDLYRTTQAMSDAAERVSQYLRRQLIVNLTCGVPIGIGLTVIGIPNAALWAIFVVLLRFVPYLGIIIAASFPLALSIAVAPGWTLLVETTALFVVVELIVANLVEPRVYGAGAGLSPVALIVAAVFWTWLWGPIGLLLSTPLTACLVVLGRHVRHLEFLDVMLGNEPVLTPQETFYQRLLAKDSDEASEQAEEFARDGSIPEFLDEVAIPALKRAQADSDRGALSARQRAEIKEAVAALLENLGDNVIEQGTTADHSLRPTTAIVPRICCVAGRNELDLAAALLLVHLLPPANRVGTLEALSADVLLSDTADPSALDDARLICLSLISTSTPTQVRYLLRRVQRRAGRAVIMVGLWGALPDELAAARETIVSSVDIVATLRDAAAKVLAFADSSGISPIPPPALTLPEAAKTPQPAIQRESLADANEEQPHNACDD